MMDSSWEPADLMSSISSSESEEPLDSSIWRSLYCNSDCLRPNSMSVESLLLIRCKESIEELNSVVSSQKGEIERLEKNSRRLSVELEDKETQRLAML